MIDYKKEFINFIKSQNIKQLPDQAVIDDDLVLAACLLINYSPFYDDKGDYYSQEECYQKLQWKKHFHKYQDNIEFWMQVFQDKRVANELLMSYFQNDFPVISNIFLSNDDFLLSLYEKTSNIEFLNKINDIEKKQTYHKYNILKTGRIDTDNIINYQNDDVFLEKALQLRPSYYIHLNEENKNKDKYIKIALQNIDMFEHIPLEYQKNSLIFDYWMNNNLSSINIKHIKKFNLSQQENFLKKQPEFIPHLLQDNLNKWGPMVKQFLREDFNKYIKYIPLLIIKKVEFKKDILNDDLLYKNLINTIQNFSSVTLDPNNEKIYYLIENDDRFLKFSEGNIFYNLLKLKLNKTKINKETYDFYIDKTFNFLDEQIITRENATKLVLGFKNSCEQSVFMKLPRSKDLFIFYEKQKITQKIMSNSNNDESNNNSKKNKL